MTETTAAPTTGKRRATFNTLEVSELRRLTDDSVEVTFAARYRVNGGAWVALDPITRSFSNQYPVQQLQSVLDDMLATHRPYLPQFWN